MCAQISRRTGRAGAAHPVADLRLAPGVAERRPRDRGLPADDARAHFVARRYQVDAGCAIAVLENGHLAVNDEK